MKRQFTWLDRIIIGLAAFFFLAPLLAAGEYSARGYGNKGHTLSNYTWIVHQLGFSPALLTSLRIAAVSVFLVMILMVPTVVYVHLGGSKYRRLVEILCLLPIVIPVVSLAIGAQVSMPKSLQSTSYELCCFYVVVAMPYVYRTLDIGLQTISLSTLVEASHSLGANWLKTLVLVIIPAIRSSTMSALFITFALSLGEYTLAILLHFHTFPTWATNASQENLFGSIAISVTTLGGAWILLVLIAFAPRIKNLFMKKERVS
jgi:putative spermidine/putrescine transport system permease protein